EPGSAFDGPLTKPTPARCAHCSSCSTPAARKVSAAARITLRSSSLLRCQASLPTVVVLPVPLTPATRITVGFASRLVWSSSPSRGRGGGGSGGAGGAG